jgi:hypothetical protein
MRWSRSATTVIPADFRPRAKPRVKVIDEVLGTDTAAAATGVGNGRRITVSHARGVFSSLVRTFSQVTSSMRFS